MKLYCSILILFFATALTSDAGIRYEDLNAAVVAPCLAALQQSPDASTVTECANRLAQAALSQAPAERTATTQLSNLLRNLASAEQRLLQARLAVSKATQAASEAETRAQQWLKPNAFGHTSPALYHNAVNAGKQKCQAAEAELHAAREYYTLLLSTTNDTIQGLELAGKPEVSESLTAATSAIVERSKRTVPGETSEYGKQLVGGLALLGLIWMGSNMASQPSEAGNEQQDNTAMNQQFERNRRAAEERRQQQEAEQRAVNEQNARWAAERMRPFN